MGDKRQNDFAGDQESVISAISDDEWAEIVKYQKEKYEEEKERERERFLEKRNQIKETLKKQMNER